jgi:hypothetical protein
VEKSLRKTKRDLSTPYHQNDTPVEMTEGEGLARDDRREEKGEKKSLATTEKEVDETTEGKNKTGQ